MGHEGIERDKVAIVTGAAFPKGIGFAAAFCASKGAVQMLTKVLAIEMEKVGIRVKPVNPATSSPRC